MFDNVQSAGYDTDGGIFVGNSKICGNRETNSSFRIRPFLDTQEPGNVAASSRIGTFLARKVLSDFA